MRMRRRACWSRSRVAFKSWHKSLARSLARTSSGSSGSYNSPPSIFSFSVRIDLPLLLFRRRLVRVLLHPQFHDPFDEFECHRFVQRELKIAFRPGVACDRFLQCFVAGDRRVQSDVLLPCSEVNQNPVLLEGGHLIADDFLGFWSSVTDRVPHLLKYCLHVSREL